MEYRFVSRSPHRMLSEYNRMVNKIGAKAAGLVWLSEIAMGNRLYVPDFVVITEDVCDDEIEDFIDASVPYYLADGKFAVRSGAKISMPGLMDTILGVKYTNLASAVMEVRKSFFSEAAQRFLETIPEDQRPSGTPVVVQVMAPSDCVYYGVIFTASHNGFPDIVAVASERPGDIVGGGSTGNNISLPGRITSSIKKVALDWYTMTGQPPELEFAYDGSVMYLLQVRNQKLTMAEKASLDNKKLVVENGEVIAKGDGYGFAKVDEVKDLAVMDNADPAEVSRIIIEEKPKMIIWRRGSVFSHAAVICRTKNVAYARYDGDIKPPFVFNDGTFFSSDAVISVVDNGNKELVVNAVKNTDWTAYDAFMSDNEEDWAPINVSPTIFISAMLAWKRYLYHHNPLDALDAMKSFVIMGVLASMGEMRHVHIHNVYNIEAKSALLKCIPGIGKHASRQDAYDALALYVRGIRSLMPIIIETFNADNAFSSSYGGERWGDVAEITLDLANSIDEMRNAEDPSSMYKSFMDAVALMNMLERIQHNNDVWFDKFGCGIESTMLNRFYACNSFDEYVQDLWDAISGYDEQRAAIESSEDREPGKIARYAITTRKHAQDVLVHQNGEASIDEYIKDEEEEYDEEECDEEEAVVADGMDTTSEDYILLVANSMGPSKKRESDDED